MSFVLTIFRSSFRSVGSCFLPARNPGKRAALLFALLATGCGGGHVATKLVGGTGYSFSAPASWKVARAPRQVAVVQGGDGLELVRVSRIPLMRAFRPELWAQVAKELDRAAEGLARQQSGSVESAKDVTIAGQRARRYDVGYRLRGKSLVETIAFVLRGRTEYFLLCRYERGKSSPACDTLLSSFELLR